MQHQDVDCTRRDGGRLQSRHEVCGGPSALGRREPLGVFELLVVLDDGL